MSRIKLLLGTIYTFGLVGILTYVPWYANTEGNRYNLGHAWLWASPSEYGALDLTTLGVEFAAWTALLAALWMAVYLVHQYRDQNLLARA